MTFTQKVINPGLIMFDFFANSQVQMSSRRYPGFKPTVQRSPPLQIPRSDDGASSSAPVLGSADTGELHAPYRPSLPDETGYQTPPSHHDMTEPGSMHMPGMHDFMMDTFTTRSPSQVASLFDDEAGTSHGVEGHQGPNGDAGWHMIRQAPRGRMVQPAPMVGMSRILIRIGYSQTSFY
jgi:hypothetical protein